MPLFGPPNIEKMKEKRNVKGLIKALYNPDHNIYSKAAEALGEIGGKQAVEPLITALQDEKWNIRMAAAKALGMIGDSRAVEPLIVVFRKTGEYSTHYAREEAAKALGKIGDLRAIEPLIDALQDKSDNIHMAAIEALGEIGDERAVEPLIDRLAGGKIGGASARALGKIGDPRAIEPLVAIAIRHDKADAVKVLVEALSKFADAAYKPLIAALKEAEWPASRKQAADILDQLGWEPGSDETAAWYWVAKRDWDHCIAMGETAAEPLLMTVRDDDINVRKAAAEALDQIGWKPDSDETAAWYWVAKQKWHQCATMGETVVEPLIAVSRDEAIKWDVVETLGKIGGPRAIKHLIDYLIVYKFAAVKALSQIGKDAVGPLISVLKADNDAKAPYIAEVLGNIGDTRAVSSLMDALRNSDSFHRPYFHVEARKALDKIGQTDIEFFINMLDDKNKSVRLDTAEVMGRLDDKRAVKPLITALKDSNGDVRGAAAEALDRLGWQPGSDENAIWYWIAKKDWNQCIDMGKTAVEPLIDVLLEDGYFVIKVIKTLSIIGDKRAVEPIIEKLKDMDGAVREAATNALIKLGDSAVESLLVALKDKDSDVRKSVVEALGKIDDPRAREALKPSGEAAVTVGIEKVLREPQRVMTVSNSEPSKAAQLSINFDGEIIRSFVVCFEWATMLGSENDRGYITTVTHNGEPFRQYTDNVDEGGHPQRLQCAANTLNYPFDFELYHVYMGDKMIIRLSLLFGW